MTRAFALASFGTATLVAVGLCTSGCGDSTTSTAAIGGAAAHASLGAPPPPASSEAAPSPAGERMALTVGPGRTSHPSVPFTFTMAPPTDGKDQFISWMVANRNEDPKFLAERWDRYQQMMAAGDLPNEATQRAFLLTPREEFVRKISMDHAYDHAFLDIGYGVTISGPNAVGRMTSVLDVTPTDKVLEIGTGSGYQSAVLAHLTPQVWSIEIIKPLADRTRAVYDGLTTRGYSEYDAIHTKQADGYYGWEEAAPFDKIVVTCGIDHIPPPLLQQLKIGGIMVIPVGPPGAQHVLKVTKTANPDGTISIARTDIYDGRVVPFVPFTKLEGNAIVGSHNK